MKLDQYGVSILGFRICTENQFQQWLATRDDSVKTQEVLDTFYQRRQSGRFLFLRKK